MFPTPTIEKLSIVAPLGLCFHDAATGGRVFDGLSVTVFPDTKSVWKKKAQALPNRSGVYVLHLADGLGEFTRGAGDAEFWQNNPPKKNYIVEVSDNENRFQPFKFTLKLPVRGIYRWENIPPVSPNKTISSIPLYSAPTRKLSGAMTVIRAELRESMEKAASFAVLEARFAGNLIARGIADRDGQIVLMFPELAPPNNPLTSPPNAVRVSLAEQFWNVDFTVKYQPAIFQVSPPFSVKTDAEILPDLRLALAQANGTLWANAAKTESFTTAVLPLGKELILRSRTPQIHSPPPSAETVFSSYLLVSPA